MSTFVYKVRDMHGVSSRGELEANSRAEVASNLRNRGLTVVEVSE